MPFHIIRDDITHLSTDAIVNAANSGLRRGGGVCGAIFKAAGAEQLERACARIGYCPTGQSVLTEGFALPARYIIHTVGPIWRGGDQQEEALLKSCYRSALTLAVEHGCRSIAFPLISSGIYGYPKQQALETAVSTIGQFLLDCEEELEVYLVVFDQESVLRSHSFVEEVARYIDQNYVDAHTDQSWRLTQINAQEVFAAPAEKAAPRDKRDQNKRRRFPWEKAPSEESMPVPAEKEPCPQDTLATVPGGLEAFLTRQEETFSQRLLRLIDERGRTDAEVYKRANIDRKHFSKIRSNPVYQPKKTTVLAFAMALELDLPQTRSLLETAGYALSHSSRQDLIVEYFLLRHNYDIFQLNEVLFAFGQPLLG